MKLVRSKLARLRKKAGYKNALDASSLLGVSRMHLLAVERGEGGSERLLEAMASLYKLDLNYLKDLHRAECKKQTERRLEALNDAD